MCEAEEDWYAGLEKLIKNVSLREEMGKRGRAKIIEQYSVQAHAGTFLGLFN